MLRSTATTLGLLGLLVAAQPALSAPPAEAKPLSEIVKMLEDGGNVAGKTDGEFLAPWTLKKGDQEFFTMPRIAAIRSFVMNHSIHHRGQLSVYLRLNDVPIPPIYGPTADEQF